MTSDVWTAPWEKLARCCFGERLTRGVGGRPGLLQLVPQPGPEAPRVGTVGLVRPGHTPPGGAADPQRGRTLAGL